MGLKWRSEQFVGGSLGRGWTNQGRALPYLQQRHRLKYVSKTLPVTKDHRWLRRWPNFTGDQTSPVTKHHRWLHWWPNFTGYFASDQSKPVTTLHRCPKVHQWPKAHRWPNFTGEFAGDQTSPVTQVYRWQNFTGVQNFTDNQTSPVTKVHRWPNFTGVRKFNGDQEYTGEQAYHDSTVLPYLPVPRRQSHWRFHGNKILFRSRVGRRPCPNFWPST